MVATQAILAWTFISECPIPNDVNEILVEGEKAIAAYKPFATVQSSPTNV